MWNKQRTGVGAGFGRDKGRPCGVAGRLFCPFGGRCGVAGEDGETAGAPSGDGFVVRPGKHRDMQVARVGKRKLFDRTRRKTFLEWFAATGNCVFSAAKAGVSYKTV